MNTDFDQVTVAAMNEIAILLVAAQEIRTLHKTFKNATELDVKAAEPHAKLVGKFCREAAHALLEALFGSVKKRTANLEKVRQEHHEKLVEAIDSAGRFSEMEEEGISMVGGKGNVVKLKVLVPLQNLKW